MFDEPFAHGRSLVHAVDPRFRLVAAFVCAVCLAVVRTPEAACFGFGMAALLLALSRPPMRPVLRRLAVVNVFIAFLWLTVPLTSGGDVIAAWGPLEVSRAGVLLTLLVTIKSNDVPRAGGDDGFPDHRLCAGAAALPVQAGFPVPVHVPLSACNRR